MLLEVLVSATVFDELGGSGEHIWVLVERNWLIDICREQVHERLDLVHLLQHQCGHVILDSERFQQCLPRKAFPLFKSG